MTWILNYWWIIRRKHLGKKNVLILLETNSPVMIMILHAYSRLYAKVAQLSGIEVNGSNQANEQIKVATPKSVQYIPSENHLGTSLIPWLAIFSEGLRLV